MEKNELRDKVESKAWRDAYLFTLILSLSLITIALIFIGIFKVWPELGDSYSRFTGGPIPALQWPFWQYLLIYLVQVVVCFLASFPLSALMYLHLINDKCYVDDTIEHIKEKEHGREEKTDQTTLH